ncbi:hypothetical protein H1C71_026328, partial [Ictidomys tridecemlineatus]
QMLASLWGRGLGWLTVPALGQKVKSHVLFTRSAEPLLPPSAALSPGRPIFPDSTPASALHGAVGVMTSGRGARSRSPTASVVICITFLFTCLLLRRTTDSCMEKIFLELPAEERHRQPK